MTPPSPLTPPPAGVRILQAMWAAVEPEHLVRRFVRRENRRLWVGADPIDLDRFHRLHCLGAGKAVDALYAGLLPLVRDRLAGGVLLGVPGGRAGGGVRRLAGDHPVPGKRSLASTRSLLDYVDREIGPRDLIIFLLSGGASALLAAPAQGVPRRDWLRLQARLVDCGAPIREINRVRSALSTVKAGRLARRIYPATLWTLALSDVIDSPPEVIGSGPTAPVSPPGAADAAAVLRRYGLDSVLSLPDMHKTSPVAGPFPPGGYRVIGDNGAALEAGRRAAQTEDFSAGILTRRLQGPVGTAARRLARVIHRAADCSRPRAGLFGGETTVRITGSGRGGRNQELALRLLAELRDLPGPWYIACAGSDGVDGNSPAAGAWVSHESAARLRGRESGLARALENNDSHGFFRRFGGLIQTGPTGTNVMDLGLILLP